MYMYNVCTHLVYILEIVTKRHLPTYLTDSEEGLFSTEATTLLVTSVANLYEGKLEGGEGIHLA